ncbi:MAG: CsgG/HfaB family protein [Oceanipulchritudo sp.]
MRNVTSLLVLSLLLTASVPSHAVLGDILDKDAESKEGKSQVDLPEYTGIKHALAVTDFENKQTVQAQVELGGALAAMLESSLYESGRFVLVERGDLADVLTEQDLQESGRAAESTETAQTGLIRSAKYLATGDITQVSDGTQGSGGGVRIKGFRIGGGGDKSELELVVKLIDTTSSSVVASKRIRGEAGGSRLSLGYVGSDFAGDLGGFAETPLGEAAQDAIAKAVEWIATEMEDYEVTANVVMVRNPEMIVINRGENFGIESGSEFVIREKGEILTDPATGEVLDVFEGEVTGRIRINRVSDKVAYAELTEGAIPERGDAVVFEP